MEKDELARLNEEEKLKIKQEEEEFFKKKTDIKSERDGKKGDLTKITKDKIEDEKKYHHLSVRFIADLSINPFIYNPFEQSYGNAMHCFIMCGVKIKNFTIAGAFRYNYISFDGSAPDSTFKGSWALFGGTFHFLYHPFKWFEFNTGVGGAWFSSAFDYNNLGTEGKDEGGLSLYFNATFIPWKYIQISIPTKLDLFFNPTTYITPYFYGGVRVDFHPYFTWLNIYIEFGGQPWRYTGDFFNTTTGLFIWTIGTSIDIDFKKIINELDKVKKVLED